MKDVIVPTWGQVNCFVVLVVIGLALFAYAWLKAKRLEERTVTWVRDWE
jgi:hypothetical protein